MTTRRKWFLLLLAGSHLIAGVILSSSARTFYGRDEMLAFVVLLLGLVAAQGGLVSLWAVFSGGRRFVRWLGASVAWLFLIAEVVNLERSRDDAIGAAIWVLAPSFLVVFVALVLRHRNVRCGQIREVPEGTPREGIQFSIAQVLSVTFSVATLLTVARTLRGMDDDSFLTGALFAWLIGVWFAVQTTLCLWATLGLGRWWWRFPLPLSVAAVGAGLFLYVNGDNNDWVGMLGLTEWQTLVVIGTLLAMRLAGYRMILAKGDGSNY